MSDAASVELSGSDLYFRHVDAAIRRGGQPGNVVHLVYELEGRVDRQALRRALDRATADHPLLTSACAGWPAARWSPVEGATVPLHDVAWSEDAGALVTAIRERPLARAGRAPWEVYVAEGPDRTTVVLRWLHALGDGAGLHLLARSLSGEEPPPGALTLPLAERRALTRRGHGPLTRFLAAHVLGLRQTLLRLLPGAWSAAVDADEPGRVILHRFAPEAAEAVAARAHAAGVVGGSTAVLAAAAAVATARAAKLGPRRRLWVPAPTTWRSRDLPGPWVSNALTGLQLPVRVGDLGSLDSAVAAVDRAWAGALRRLEHVVAEDALELARVLPPPLFELLLRGPALRIPDSVYCSYVRLELPSDGRMFGRPCARAALVGTVPRRPGLGTLWTRCSGQLQVAVVTNGNRLAPALRDELAGAIAEL